MAPVRIGVNALYLIPGGVGGTEIYLRSLLEALSDVDPVNEYFVFTNTSTDADLVPDRPNFHVVSQPVRAQIRPLRIAWEQAALPVAAMRWKLDVLFNPGFTAPLVCPCPMLTVFHDLQHKRHPENFRWFDLPFWRMLLYGAAHRSAVLVAVSDETRADLTRFYGLSGKRVRVVPHGVDPAFFEIARRRPNAPAGPRFLLSVSTLHPHKNLDKLIEAYALFHRGHPEYRLIIAGLRGFHTAELERLRTSLGLDEAVTFTGWIPRHQLYELFMSADAFFYPSRFEGFGMPVLEALAAGIPTACSRVEPFSRMAGDAALQFEPGDVNGICAAMERITSDTTLRTRLEQAGPRLACQFTWEAAARATLSALLAARKS